MQKRMLGNTSNLEANELQQQNTDNTVSSNWKLRVQLTLVHQNWTIHDWKNVDWSDEF